MDWVDDECRSKWAALGRRHNIDHERIAAQISKAGDYQASCNEAAAVSLRLRRTGEPEPLPIPTCINCQGVAGEPLRQYNADGSVLFECGMDFHVVSSGDGYHRIDIPAPPPPPDEIRGRGRFSDRYVKQTVVQPALLPCRECGELPIGGTVENGEYDYDCTCGNASRGSNPAQAREEWNRRFGRDVLTPAIRETIARIEDKDLTPCECGQIPRPVAYQSTKGGNWYWQAACGCGKGTGGYSSWASAARHWEHGDFFYSAEVGRYDIPTTVTLGCAQLPEEYREPKPKPRVILDGPDENICPRCDGLRVRGACYCLAA